MIGPKIGHPSELKACTLFDKIGSIPKGSPDGQEEIRKPIGHLTPVCI